MVIDSVESSAGFGCNQIDQLREDREPNARLYCIPALSGSMKAHNKHTKKQLFLNIYNHHFELAPCPHTLDRTQLIASV
jgi:hypothetical protein